MVNRFTEAILSAADRPAHLSPRHTSPKHNGVNVSSHETEEWEELEQSQAKFVAPVKIKGEGGIWWKDRTMQVEGHQLVFRKLKDTKVNRALELTGIASQVHDGVLYLREANEECIWRVKVDKDSGPDAESWCTHIVQSSQELEPARPEAASESAPNEMPMYVVPLPPSYTSKFKVKFDQHTEAWKLQQQCCAELHKLVHPEHRDVEQTALVYASISLERMVQAGSPAGFWEKCSHVDHYTLGQPGSDRLLKLSRHLIFISRSEPQMIEQICGLIKAHSEQHPQSALEYTVACIPNVSVLAQKIFLTKIAEECRADVDAQVYTLCAQAPDEQTQRTGAQRVAQSGAWAEQLAHTAQGIYWLELIFGGFKTVQLKGDISANLFQMLQTHRAEHSPFVEPSSSKTSKNYSRLILLDRDLDYVSVLCTQVSYGGLIEEIFGSPEAASEFIVGAEGCCELSFTVADPVWAEVQDENLDNARNKVSARCKNVNALKEEFARLKQQNALSVDNIKEFARVHLPEIQQLNPLCEAHMKLLNRIYEYTFEDQGIRMQLVATQNIENGLYGCNWYIENREAIKEHIHEIMFRGSGMHDLARALRLLCLATLTAGGLRGDDLDEFRTAILQNYGFGAVSLLQALEAAKLLSGDISWRAKSGLMATDWEKVKDQYKLVSENFDEENCSAGYMMLIPLVTRLLTLALQGQWDAKTLERIPGAVEEYVHVPEQGAKGEQASSASDSSSGQDTGTVFVMFTNGCTRAEISEVRRVAKQQGRKIVILTTGIITGNDFIMSFADPHIPLV